MSALRHMYQRGVKEALAKFALGPPTQVDQFMADVESGKDIPPSGTPPMSHVPGDVPPALDGTVPLSTSPPTPPDTIGSTVGQPPPLAGDPAAQMPPSLSALHG